MIIYKITAILQEKNGDFFLYKNVLTSNGRDQGDLMYGKHGAVASIQKYMETRPIFDTFHCVTIWEQNEEYKWSIFEFDRGDILP